MIPVARKEWQLTGAQIPAAVARIAPICGMPLEPKAVGLGEDNRASAQNAIKSTSDVPTTQEAAWAGYVRMTGLGRTALSSE